MDCWEWAVILRVVGCELSAHNSAGGAERSGAVKLAAEEEERGCEQWAVITMAVIKLAAEERWWRRARL